MDGISRIIILQLIAVVSWSEIDLSLFEKPLFHLLVKTQPKHSHRLSSRYRFLVEFPSFWNTRYFTWNTYLVFQIQCAKNLVFQTFSFEMPSFFYPNAMFSIEILGFSSEILGISNFVHVRLELRQVRCFLTNMYFNWRMAYLLRTIMPL